MKKYVIIIAILLLGLALAGCAARGKQDQSFSEFAWDKESPVSLTAAQHEQVADGFLRRGKPEMAFIHFNKALEQEPENMDVRVKKGDLLVSKGLDEQALAEFLYVLKRQPDHAIANEAAGTVYFRAGLYDEARTHLGPRRGVQPHALEGAQLPGQPLRPGRAVRPGPGPLQPRPGAAQRGSTRTRFTTTWAWSRSRSGNTARPLTPSGTR